jgi:hypothetical protein
VTRSILALSLLSLLLPVSALADCRDATGEPIACPSPPVPAAPLPPAPSLPPIEPAPVEPSAPREPDPAMSFMFDLSGESLDLRPLHLTPAEPADVADLARGTMVGGSAAPFDVPAMTFGIALAGRPLPWLELPVLRFAWGFGTPETTVPVLDQTGRSAELGAMLHVRIEIGAGFDVPVGDVVSIFARGHLALAGYFVSTRIVDDALGSLGRTWLAEDAWEAGWTAGVTLRIDRDVRWALSYRHVHTGAESHVVTMGITADIR